MALRRDSNASDTEDTPLDDGVPEGATIRALFVKCGRCPRAHGAYLYWEKRDSEGRVRTGYIGKRSFRESKEGPRQKQREELAEPLPQDMPCSIRADASASTFGGSLSGKGSPRNDGSLNADKTAREADLGERFVRLV